MHSEVFQHWLLIFENVTCDLDMTFG